MAQNFLYKAKNRSGQLITGTIMAENESAVASYVRDQGYFVTAIKSKRGNASLNDFMNKFQRVTMKEMAVFCRQFSTMVDAGLPIVTCLGILIEQTANPKFKSVLQDVYKQVKEGETFSKSLGLYPDVFPNLMINMIEAGELGGILDNVLERLAVYFEKEYKMRGKVKSALTYPAVIMLAAIACVVAVLVFVMPTFVTMFKDMNLELPLLTQVLIDVSNALQNHGLLILAVLIALIIAFVQAYKKNRKFHFSVDNVLLKLPIFGEILKKIAVARFSRTLGTLVKSGVSLLMALDVVKKSSGNLVVFDALENARENVKEGISFSRTLSDSPLFPSMVTQMIAIGEESGAMDRMLEKIADFYESEVDDVVSRLSSILEPVIIMFLGITVGTIIMAIMIPLFSLVSGQGMK
ncbi:MAG: type II secretion system F family protein [Pelosinus sp.]|nr:type II secretion system F family protein [Pelosinus sp.]